MSIATIEKLLGRPMREKERGTVASLTELPSALIEEARLVARESRLLATRFLSYYLADPRLDTMAEYIDEVLLGGADLDQWLTREYFCMPDPNWEPLLRSDATSQLAPLALLGESHWCRPLPRFGHWHLDTAGAPGILVRRSFEWIPPAGARTVRYDSRPAIEPVSDLPMALGRWIASRIAWVMKPDPARDTPTTISADEVARRFRVPADELSELARTSIAGLAREIATLGWSGDAIPGFRGPDDWYRSSSALGLGAKLDEP
jgi:hypothetical protein